MPDLFQPSRPEIVKLGGSLVGDPRLPALLDALAGRGAPLILVTGGGPLADGVRALQPRLALSDAACHRMAILAMEQTAHAFADLAPGLALVATPGAMAEAHGQGRAALWLPAGMALAATDLPENWDLTSDSLATWLAAELGAVRLTLVKSVAAASGTAADWAVTGLVDPLFPVFAARLACPVHLTTVDALLAELNHGDIAA
ncbi:aspartate kinase [Ancylobacter sp.]|uniref:amino acid kinase family protein n=1 Tax=Ancylobacter sp. TaxID=1872567 RepID=UPI003D0F0183